MVSDRLIRNKKSQLMASSFSSPSQWLEPTVDWPIILLAKSSPLVIFPTLENKSIQAPSRARGHDTAFVRISLIALSRQNTISLRGHSSHLSNSQFQPLDAPSIFLTTHHKKWVASCGGAICLYMYVHAECKIILSLGGIVCRRAFLARWHFLHSCRMSKRLRLVKVAYTQRKLPVWFSLAARKTHTEKRAYKFYSISPAGCVSTNS